MEKTKNWWVIHMTVTYKSCYTDGTVTFAYLITIFSDDTEALNEIYEKIIINYYRATHDYYLAYHDEDSFDEMEEKFYKNISDEPSIDEHGFLTMKTIGTINIQFNCLLGNGGRNKEKENNMQENLLRKLTI